MNIPKDFIPVDEDLILDILEALDDGESGDCPLTHYRVCNTFDHPEDPERQREFVTKAVQAWLGRHNLVLGHLAMCDDERGYVIMLDMRSLGVAPSQIREFIIQKQLSPRAVAFKKGETHG